MKTTLRRLLTLAVAVVLCLSMTGCIALDDMRKAQAFYNTNEAGDPVYTAFTWNGAVYKELQMDDVQLAIKTGQRHSIYVTEKDVPVLLSVGMGREMTVSENGILARCDGSEKGEPFYYCRADEYDAIVAQITSGNIDFTRCYYSWYDLEKEEYDSYELSEAEYAAVQTVYNTVEPEELPEGANMEFDYYAELNQLSENGVFEKYWLDVCVAGKTYYLCEYDEAWNMTLYTVPKKLNAEFESLIKKAIQAYEQEMEFLYGEDWEEWEDDMYGEDYFL